MDRPVWVGAFPRKDKGVVRSLISTALEAGFDQIVLSEADASLQRIGHFSPILLTEDVFSFDDEAIGRLATIR
ncbi:MAG: hypothetical protein E6J98_04460, partial [Methanobacteriota archaeon]